MNTIANYFIQSAAPTSLNSTHLATSGYNSPVKGTVAEGSVQRYTKLESLGLTLSRKNVLFAATKIWNLPNTKALDSFTKVRLLRLATPTFKAVLAASVDGIVFIDHAPYILIYDDSEKARAQGSLVTPATLDNFGSVFLSLRVANPLYDIPAYVMVRGAYDASKI